MSIFKTFEAIKESEKVALEKLSQGEHATPPKGYPTDRNQYADPEFYMFRIDAPEYVRAAITYFHKHEWKEGEGKKEAAKRILSKAKEFGIDVSNTSYVYKAAHE